MSNDLIWFSRLLMILLFISAGLVGFTLATRDATSPVAQFQFVPPTETLDLRVNLLVLATPTQVLPHVEPSITASPITLATQVPSTLAAATSTAPARVTTAQSTTTPVRASTQPAPAKKDVVLAAAGSIACSPSKMSTSGSRESACRAGATAEILVSLRASGQLDAVAALGDNAYEKGTLEEYKAVYDPTWGRLRDITFPTPGNHEYLTAGAAGYFQYFGAAAGDTRKGYYSYDLGAWHVIVLNSNCSQIGKCSQRSPQEQWLQNDLAQSAGKCVLAYWHNPRFSSGEHGNDDSVQAFWQDLYSYGAAIVLNGHSDNYERFAPQDPSARQDPNGIREFVVGTGGEGHSPLFELQPNTQVFNDNTFGVLKLTLHANSYDWQFIPEPSRTFTDSGAGNCQPRHP